MTFAKLLCALRSNQRGILLTGEYGCGKTMLSRSLVKKLDPDITEVALLTSTSPTPTELLREILYQVGEMQLDGDHTEIVHRLNENFSLGKTVLVIINEEHTPLLDPSQCRSHIWSSCC